MAVLLFQAGGQRYALELALVERILPHLTLRPLPHLPPWLAGLLEYQGHPLPVVELCRLLGDKPCRDRMSTRLILVHYPAPPGYRPLLGLLAEEVLQVVEPPAGGFQSPGLAAPETPYLGGLAATGGQAMVQRLTPEELLPPPVRQRLFPPLDPGEESP